MTDFFTQYSYPRTLKWKVWSNRDDIWYTILKDRFNLAQTVDIIDSTFQRIPKIIHQIWLGSPVPQKYKKWMKTWKDFHPDWKYCLWTLDNLEDLQNKEAFNQATNYGEKSDILRYEILYKYGGLYVDIDFECLSSFESLFEKYTFFCGLSNTGTIEINNALIASIPSHPILLYLIKSIQRLELTQDEAIQVTEKVEEMLSSQEIGKGKNTKVHNYLLELFHPSLKKSNHSIITYTGPGIFTKTIMKFIETPQMYGQERLMVFPNQFFYPLPNTNYNQENHQLIDLKEYSNSYAVHYWSRSWQEEIMLKKEL